MEKTVYWTKYVTDEETGETWLETIHKDTTELGMIPDGDGFEIDMNNIDYEEYLAHPDDYVIELPGGVLRLRS